MTKKVNIGVSVLAIALITIAACGSSKSSSTAADAAKAAVKGFGNVLDVLSDTSVCTYVGGVLTCPCSGGGTLTVTGVTVAASVSKGTITATTASCVDATSDLTYTGTMTVDDENGSATIIFAEFGGCTGVEGFATIGGLGTETITCTGEIKGICAGESYTCVLTTSGGDCICI